MSAKIEIIDLFYEDGSRRFVVRWVGLAAVVLLLASVISVERGCAR
ncbi:MAG: hypothetical protein GXP35_18500 [Actinobacteria bacterium]|nr:hypothetical protein [Actinomycetota bacterium]